MTAIAGQTVTLRVEVASQTALTYQWLRDGVVMPGETAVMLRLNNVRKANEGSYVVRVSNAAGTVPSKAADLKVKPFIQLSFAPAVDFPAGSQPAFVAIGDIDGDGNRDLAIANYASDTVSVFRNMSSKGAISFAAKVDFQTGHAPASVAIGDLNGDSGPDLVTANSGADTISVLQNMSSQGAISFADKVDFLVGSDPTSVAIGDLDGDHHPDLATANALANTVSIYRNQSAVGTITLNSFAARVDFPAASGPVRVVIDDLDRDGNLDLITANVFNDSVSVYRNKSSAGTITTDSFDARVDFSAGTNTESVAIGDLDGDGNPDLVAANASADTVSVFQNTTNSFVHIGDFPAGIRPRSVAIGDLDGDKRPDIVTANFDANTVSVFLNMSSTGGIDANTFAFRVDFPSGLEPNSVAIGDVDGDGKLDLVVANQGSGTVSVYRNTASYVTPISIPISGIAFTVRDDSSTAANLVLTATSSNTQLVPNDNILVSGSGTNRTLTISPLPNQAGSTRITVTVTDASGLANSDSILVTVSPPPTANPGDKLWEFDAAGSGLSVLPAIGADGTIYFGTGAGQGVAGRFYALNPDGTTKWTLNLADLQYTDPLSTAPAIAPDGTIYIGSELGRLFAFKDNGSNGQLKWSFPSMPSLKPIYSSPALGKDGTIYFGSTDNMLYAIKDNQTNATKKWAAPVTGQITLPSSSPAVGPDGTIYMGSADGILYAVEDRDTQYVIKPLFRTPHGDKIDASPAIGSDGTIFVGAFDSSLYAITTNGVATVILPANGVIGSSAAVGSNETVYVGSYDHQFYAVRGGKNIWTRPVTTGGEVRSSPAISEDGNIYVGSNDGLLYSISAADGKVNWKFDAKSSFEFYSPTVGRDGTIYIGNSNGNLYAIKGTGRLAAGAWPMFGHDVRHTANASTGISPLQFLSSAFLNGTFRSSLAGTPGSPVVIEAASDLMNWSPIVTTNLGADGMLNFSDTTAQNSKQRFYRGRKP